MECGREEDKKSRQFTRRHATVALNQPKERRDRYQQGDRFDQRE